MLALGHELERLLYLIGGEELAGVRLEFTAVKPADYLLQHFFDQYGTLQDQSIYVH
tara:strand:+ start:533 stop:700 length:168 start_codon:yes stop_codon:yes gene_type:complete